jgi:hypothetical protein
MPDFLTPACRRLLDALGNAGAIIEWHAVTADGAPIAPEIVHDQSVRDDSVIVVWPDETAARITATITDDPHISTCPDPLSAGTPERN